MKLKLNNNYIKWGLTAFGVIAAGILFTYLVFNATSFVNNIRGILSVTMPVAVGLVIAYLLTPIVNFFEGKIITPLCNKMNIKDTKRRKSVIRGITVFITLIIVIFSIYSLIAMLVSQIVPSFQNIVNNFDTYIKNATVWLNELPVENEEVSGYALTLFVKVMAEVEKWLDDTASIIEHSGEILKTVSLSVLSFLGVTWDVIIGLIISIYVLASKEKFVGQAKKITYAAFETNTANNIIKNMRFIHKTFGGFISGKILDSIIIGILCFMGTMAMGTPYAALISVIVGITNVIPFFGPYLGAIPSAILILLVDFTHPLNCLYFLIFILVLQQLDGNVIGPKILGDSTGLSGFWVIFAITIFGGLMGIMGMVIGVPVFAIFYAVVKSLVKTALEKRALPTETLPYMTVGSIDDKVFSEYTPPQKKTKAKKDKNETSINEKSVENANENENSEAGEDN